MTNEADVFDALKYNVTCDEFGTRIYCNAAGLLHRENGPAYSSQDQDGYLYQAWYVNGERHRVGGPAIIHRDGPVSWFLNGVQYTEQEYNNIVALLGTANDQ